MQIDPITRLYSHAAALRTIATRQPETEAGLSLILRLLADDIEECGDALEGGEHPCPARPLQGPLAEDVRDGQHE